MPDDASTADTTTDTTADTTAADGQTFTQEQVNSFLAEQKRKIGDVKELKAAAVELAAIKESQKTDVQKTADRLAAADAEVATVPAKVAEALKAYLVDLHKINEKDARLFLNATEPATLLEQMQGLIERDATSSTDRKKQGNFVPREGTTSTVTEGDGAAEARALFGNG